MVGAVLGPELAARGELWVESARFTGTFLAVGCCYVIAGVLLLWLRTPRVAAASSAAGGARPMREIVRNRTFVVAVLGGAAGFGVMAFVMTAAPLAMHVVDGHSLAHTATVIQAHILGMYAPSLVTGILLSRFGCRPVMLVGAVTLGLSVATGFAGREVTHYGLSMIALGVGWNFCSSAERPCLAVPTGLKSGFGPRRSTTLRCSASQRWAHSAPAQSCNSTVGMRSSGPLSRRLSLSWACLPGVGGTRLETPPSDSAGANVGMHR